MGRADAASPSVWGFAGFQFDGGSGELFRLDGSKTMPVALGVRAAALLGLLIEQHGKLVSKNQIMDAVWQGRIVEEANLTVQVAALRRVLDLGRDSTSLIQTVSGRGYRLVAPVTRLEAPEPSPRRRLAAVLAADVAGYSRLMGADEEGTARRVRDQRGTVEPLVIEHGGRIVKTTGDGMLIEFGSVVGAVKCAIALQKLTAERQVGIPDDRQLQLRIGVHLGDVLVEGDDILGDGVNIAARLEGIAEPGGICISDEVFRQVQSKVDADFADIGEQQLKNIARPVRVYRVQTGVPAALPVAVLPLPEKPSIAVLPFQNLSGDPEQDYFADGMVEEIITALSRIRWLFVIARNSSFTYKGQAVDVKQVARELGVRYVLEGSVRKAGARVRIAGQLIDAETSAHLWADRFDGSLEDVFELQDKIAVSVAGVIEPTLQAAEMRRSAANLTTDVTAYDLYLRSLAIFYPTTKEHISQALSLLEQAIAIDPHYAPALSWAALCHFFLAMSGWTAAPETSRDEATALARRALQSAQNDPGVLVNAAYILASCGEDIGAMIAFVERALAFNPSFARGWHISGVLRSWAGQPDLAIEHLETSLRLSPRERTDRPLSAMGIAYFFKLRFDEAAAKLILALQENPAFPLPYRFLAACYAHMGRLDEARATIDRLRSITPVLVSSNLPWRNPEDRELFLSGLRRATGETK